MLLICSIEKHERKVQRAKVVKQPNKRCMLGCIPVGVSHEIKNCETKSMNDFTIKRIYLFVRLKAMRVLSPYLCSHVLVTKGLHSFRLVMEFF